MFACWRASMRLLLLPPPLWSQVCVRFTWFMPALVEKAGVLLAMGDWEQARTHACALRAWVPSAGGAH